MGTLYAYAQYRGILDGIDHIAVTDLGKRPPQYNKALNLLLIGSDSRSGKNGKIGGHHDISGQRSDTVMIVHISPGRKRIYVLSFPRDSVVPVYQCDKEPGFAGQAAQPAGNIEQLNATFAYGGPGCLWKTLEHTTHIRINDFIELNFTGFISVINALGGVEVCLPTAIEPSPYDHLKLSAGRHFLYGYRALEFWRLREDFGLGSDLQRIQRDQLLMVALVQRILKTGVLHSPAKTYSIVSAIVHAHALTTDNGLTPQKLLDVGESMSGISRKSVQFIEVPVIEYQPEPDWVQFDPTQAPKLFSAVAHDVKLPKLHKPKKGAKGKGAKGAKGKATTKSAKPGPTKLLSASDVSVEVLNGSGVQGIAGTTGTALTSRGFHVLGAASALSSAGAPDFSYVKSVVEYSSAADLPAAETVAAQLSDVTLQLNSSVTAGTVDLILGSDFSALKSVKQSQSTSPGNLAGQYNGYTGGTNVCKGYGSAFSSI
ncbi:MAG TPA: LCP family protein [Streptosporangiaceae bacterium]|jgi:LCP family protein required for cell wall assembly|nr:LCP family protein [Streptosporangiaceae bacterium]